MDATQIITLSVLAGAYRGGRKSLKITLTHSVLIEGEEIALCKQPNMADPYSADEEEKALPPTCPKCLRLDPRFKK